MNAYGESLKQILTPEILNFNLKFISIYIAVYESFKEHIVSKVKYFFLSGIEDGKEQFQRYDEEVLSLSKSKENRQIKGTLEWLKKVGCINDEDIKLFKTITDIRNDLTHNMANKLFEGVNDQTAESFVSMIKLFEKIDKWWIMEIEVPTCGQYTAEEQQNIDWDQVTSVDLEFLRIITDVALSGNTEYLKILNRQEETANA